MTTGIRQLWKSEFFNTAIMIVVVIAVVFGFWFGSQTVLGVQYPALAVASGSMYHPHGAPVYTPCDGWSHPFDPTLSTGDLIIVQAVKTEDIYAAPYNESGRSGDILVFLAGNSGDELIVHRAVGKEIVDGQILFITQGDNNGSPGPYSPTPANDVIGKVIMRIPWVGHLVLFMHDSSAVYVIVIILILLIIADFAFPALRTGKKETEPEKYGERD